MDVHPPKNGINRYWSIPIVLPSYSMIPMTSTTDGDLWRSLVPARLSRVCCSQLCTTFSRRASKISLGFFGMIWIVRWICHVFDTHLAHVGCWNQISDAEKKTKHRERWKTCFGNPSSRPKPAKKSKPCHALATKTWIWPCWITGPLLHWRNSSSVAAAVALDLDLRINKAAEMWKKKHHL